MSVLKYFIGFNWYDFFSIVIVICALLAVGVVSYDTGHMDGRIDQCRSEGEGTDLFYKKYEEEFVCLSISEQDFYRPEGKPILTPDEMQQFMDDNNISFGGFE